MKSYGDWPFTLIIILSYVLLIILLAVIPLT